VSLKKVPLLIALCFSSLAWAEEPVAVKSEDHSLQKTLQDGQTQIWIFPGYSAVRSSNLTHSGFHLGLGLQFSAAESDKAVFGLSLQRPFNDEKIDRYDVIAHLGYRLFSRLDVGLLLGLEYLDYSDSSNSNLKPLMGVELKFKAIPTRYGFISFMLNYRVAKGGTGSLLLDGGGEANSAKLFAAGMTYSFRLFEE